MYRFKLYKSEVFLESFFQKKRQSFFACLIHGLNRMRSSNSDTGIIEHPDMFREKKSGGFFGVNPVSRPALLLLFALLISVCGVVSASTIDYSHDTPLREVKKKQLQNKDQFKLYLPVDKQRPGILEKRAINSLVMDDVDQELWEEAELTWKNMRQAASGIEKIWKKAELWLNAIIFKDIGDWQTYAQPAKIVSQQISPSRYINGFYNRLILSDQQVMSFNQHFSGIGFLTLASKQSSSILSNHANNAQVEYYARQNSDSNKRRYAESDKKAIVKLLYLWKRHFNKLAIVFGMIVIWLLIKNSIRLMRPKY